MIKIYSENTLARHKILFTYITVEFLKKKKVSRSKQTITEDAQASVVQGALL